MRGTRTVLALAAVSVLAGAGAQANAVRPAGVNCAAQAHEVGGTTARPSDVRCFATFAEAVSYATGGTVRLDTGASRADQLAAFRLAAARSTIGIIAASKTVLGIDYWDIDYGGAAFVWWTTNPEGCNDGSRYEGDFYNAAAWNDVTSSAESFQGCSYFGHHEHEYQGGAAVDCGYSCSYIGDAMNDRTSSVSFAKS